MSSPSSAAPTRLRRTPFHQFHLDQGAKMVEYAGWEMPLLYSSIIDEHRQVRSSGGFFDVSHMGRLRFTGRHARRFLDLVCTRRILGMENGQCRYGLVCNEEGGCRDDVLIYRFDEDDYLMVCNAANRAKLLEHFAAVKGEMVFRLEDQTESTAMAAVQGPRVMETIGRVSREVPALKRYRFVQKSLLIVKLIVSRTGYTGEDGVEIILGAGMARTAMGLLLKDLGGESAAIRPAGLGARDTLRLEAGMPLYGHEIDEHIDPLSAGLAFAVSLDKGTGDDREARFIGQEALLRIAETGPARRLVGLLVDGRRSPRQGMTVHDGTREIGVVTSGCLSPSLDRPVAMALVDAACTEVGVQLSVDMRGTLANATVTQMPFVPKS